ncbi:MAG: cytochrome c biogenesis protein CcsA [Flavobacteriales bacterium]
MAVLLVLYAIIAGMLIKVPALPILHETIRNLFYHVPMWFSMMTLMIVSVIYSVKYLSSSSEKHDIIAWQASVSGLFFGFMGIFTGMVWANFTWGQPWPNDPKLNGSAITILIYLAYIILRNSVQDEQKRARVSAVYNIFAFVMLVVFLMVLPRITDSLHPGNGGNPAFSTYDLDSRMRLVFYPAYFGWTLIGVWMLNVRYRISMVERILMFK